MNGELVAQGYAQVVTIPPNVRHRKMLIALQRRAWDAKKGLWIEEEARQYRQPRQSGVIGAPRAKRYYHLGDDEWGSHDALVYFESEQDARATGYAPSFNFPSSREREMFALYGGSYAIGSITMGNAWFFGSGWSFDTYGGRRTPGTDVNVRGYMREGTYVAPYTRGLRGSRSTR